MRITFVNAARDSWGAEQSMLTLAAALREEGHEPSLVCYSAQLDASWRARVGPASSFVGAGDRGALPRSLPDMLALARSRRVLDDTDAIVLFSHFLSPALPIIRLRRALARRRRTVLAIDLHDFLVSRRGRLSLALGDLAADRLLAVSAFVLTQLRVRRRRATVLHRPVAAPPRSAETGRSADGDFRVGIVGRLDPEKNHLLLGRAIAALPELRMIVRGGESPYAPGYARALQDELTVLLGDRARFEGRVPVDVALDGLDALVVCNRAEPLGRTVLEGQIAGVPVIVPDAGGAAELVEDGVSGLVYAADSVQSLQSALERLVGDPLLAERLRATGRLRALDGADPHAYARRYAAALAPRS